MQIEYKLAYDDTLSEEMIKEAGIELIYVSEILTGMPQSEFETIAWINKPEWDVFREDTGKIAFDMLKG